MHSVSGFQAEGPFIDFVSICGCGSFITMITRDESSFEYSLHIRVPFVYVLAYTCYLFGNSLKRSARYDLLSSFFELFSMIERCSYSEPIRQ